MSKSKEVMDQIAEAIIKSIEEGTVNGKWEKPWVNRTQPMGGMPINATTRKPYTGGNVFYLWIIGYSEGFASSEWATYKQWESIGAQVRKGQTGTRTIRWNLVPCKDHAKDKRCSACPMVPNVFVLFNADQVDGYEPKDVEIVDEEHHNPEDRHQVADLFFEQVGAEVTFGGQVAAYWPQTDRISMPNFDDFRSADGFYATLAHEHIHWTGHSSRLDRGISGHRDENYAKEELVAELGAAMLCAVLGVEEEPRPDHAQYLKSWVAFIKEDSKVLWKAASQASKAVDYLRALVPAKEVVAA